MKTSTSTAKGRYDLENSIGYLLNRTASLIAARFGDDLKEHDVGLQAWRILAALSQSESLTLSQVANHTGAELSYLSRSAAQLEERGLIERSKSGQDKRTIYLCLTDEGHDLVRELAPKGRAVERLSRRGVSDADLATTLRTLHAVCHNLVPQPDTATTVNRKLTIARRVKQRAVTMNEKPTPRQRTP